MGHQTTSFITNIIAGFFMLLFVFVLMGMVGGQKPWEGERRQALWLIAASVVCLLIGFLLPE